MARLKDKYLSEIVPEMVKEFSYKNRMQVPRLEKITVNMGVGEAKQDPKAMEAAVRDLAQIAGQKPVTTRAKRSIAGFKLRAGMPIGCKVTLRGEHMYEFLDRLMSVALPRVRDFKGLKPSLDGRGNFTIGLEEQLVFPEIDYDKIDKIRGMNITLATTAKNNEEGLALLKHFGMPFKQVGSGQQGAGKSQKPEVRRREFG